jgi:mersacidin/lichenicidin family type 2 lantibiotic
MSRKMDVIRALKDADYRDSLSDEERALLPESQAGVIELESAEMEEVHGGLALFGSYSCTKSWGGGCHCHCPSSDLTLKL